MRGLLTERCVLKCLLYAICANESLVCSWHRWLNLRDDGRMRNLPNTVRETLGVNGMQTHNPFDLPSLWKKERDGFEAEFYKNWQRPSRT